MVTMVVRTSFFIELGIRRKILDSVEIQVKSKIHTFSDASQKAYGAAAFLRVKHKDRVELTGSACCTLSEGSQENPRSEVFNRAFSGRTLRSPYIGSKSSHRLKPFVANRVHEIQSLTDLTRGSTVPARTTQQIYLNQRRRSYNQLKNWYGMDPRFYVKLTSDKD
ncbi:hypothetical protein TNCV_3977081 [Trichonephila clavipes]|nr:hypothetical protein TNCV_3977081 [Trichonephila clavipes]